MMALHLPPPNPRNDVFAYSPKAQFAVLPDLPYGGRPRSSTTSAAPSLGSYQHALSAPTSPMSRPHHNQSMGLTPLSHINPISLSSSHPGRSGGSSTQFMEQAVPETGRVSLGPFTNQFAPRQHQQHVQQPTQSQPGQTPLVLLSPRRISPPSTVAPLSSTNLASLSTDRNTALQDKEKDKARYRSKSRPRVLAQAQREESGSDTERGGSDSDATVMDFRRAGKASYSQTDLTAFRDRLSLTPGAGSSTLGNDAGPPVPAVGGSSLAQGQGPLASASGVNDSGNSTASWTGFRGTDELTRPRQRKHSPKTPPHRPLPITTQTAPTSTSVSNPGPGTVSPGKSPRSRSSTSLSSMRMTPSTSPRSSYFSLGRSPNSSPRNSSHHLAPLTPLSTSSSSISLSPLNRNKSLQPTGSDADAEDDSTESSVTFGTRSRSGIRLRTNAPSSNGLGLSLDPGPGPDTTTAPEQTKVDDLIPQAIERLYQSSSLLYLRILAIVPACWGYLVLVDALRTGVIRHDVWPWGLDLSKEAIYHLSQISADGHGSPDPTGTFKPAVRGDLVLSIAWAVLTGHFCFRFTTGLTYRWRSYYDLLPVLVRLLALQGLCWYATYLTLSYLGPSQPLSAWAVIGVSTGFTYAVIMWLASNVLPDPEDLSRSRSRSRSRSPKTSPKRYPIFPVWGEAPLIAPPEPPAHLSRWERLNYKRRWDWDAVAREVGWKVGALLLVTLAWVFLQIHMGWLGRVE